MPEINWGKVVAINGHDLSCIFNDVTMSFEVDSLDATTFCTDGTRAFIPGLQSGTVSASGFYRSVPATDEAIEGIKQRESNIITFAQGRTTGVAALLVNARLSSWSAGDNPVGEIIAHAFEASVTADQDNSLQWGKLQHGTLLMFAEGVDDAHNGTSWDSDGADDPPIGWASEGFFAHVHVDGDEDFNTTEWEVTIQHSANNSTWVDLAVVTGTGSGVEQYVDAVEGTIEQYRRAIVSTFDGSGTATFIVGFARGANIHLVEDFD